MKRLLNWGPNARMGVISLSIVLCVSGCSSIAPNYPTYSSRDLQRFATKTDLWLIQAQLENGVFPYAYDPSTDQHDAKVIKRHQLIISRRLFDLALIRTRFQNIAETHVRAIDESLSKDDSPWNSGELVPPQSSPSPDVETKNEQTLGDQALWLRTLIQLDAGQRSNRTQAVANQLLARWDAESRFPETIQSRHATSTFMQHYYSGQAALAMMEFHARASSNIALETAEDVLDWLELKRPAANHDTFHPTLAPWRAFAIARHYEQARSPKYLPQLFALSDQLLSLQTDHDFPGRFWSEKTSKYGRPNATRDALSTLTLIKSLEIVHAIGDTPPVKRYRRGIWLALDNLRSLQYDYGIVSAFPNPQAAVGAIRFRHNDAMIRSDAVVFSAEAFERSAKLVNDGLL